MSYKAIVFFILFFFNMMLMNTVFADQPIINNMIFFGDSLSDIGDNTWIFIDGVTGAPITNPNDQNRKYLWPNYLVEEKLNKPVYPSSQLNLNPFNDSISYAYASAETNANYSNVDWPQEKTPAPSINQNCTEPGVIRDATGNITSTCLPGLLRQVDIYLNDVQHKPSSQSVFFIWAGANDLLNYFTADMARHYRLWMLLKFCLPEKEQLDIVEQKTVDNIITAEKRLIDAGVKADMIYILDLPDLSKTPAVLNWSNFAFKLAPSRKEMLEKSLSDMSRDFNQKLRSQKVEERYVIPASHYVEIGNLFDGVIANPDQYHLSNTNESCVDKKALPACSGYLFYNKKHPTTFVHKIIADVILEVLNV